MAASRCNIFVGAETGIFKGVNSHKRNFSNLNSLKELNKECEINVICWKNQEETEVCVGLRNQTVQVYNSHDGDVQETYSVEGGTGPLRGLYVNDGKLLTCTESGHVAVWNGTEKLESFEVGGNIHRMRQNVHQPHIIATGGKENDLQIWDINAHDKPIFKAKNVPNNFLNLRVPIWVTDMAALPDGRRYVVSTSHHQIRVYDPSSPKRRPVLDVQLDEYPLTTLSTTHRENCIVVGNSQGRMFLFDIRRGLQAHCFRGFAGSVRGIQCHSSLPIIASCSLDRFVRIHDLNTCQLTHKIYLKSRLNCLLLRTDFNVGSEDLEDVKVKIEPEVLEDDSDPLWDDMDVVQIKDKKKEVSIQRKTKNKVARIDWDDCPNNSPQIVKKKRK